MWCEPQLIHQFVFAVCSYRSSVRRSLFLSPECVETTKSSKMTDIYLMGESGDDIRWKEDIAIPMIKYVFYGTAICLNELFDF